MNELYHYGVKGMKWGVRRYQNLDGSLTPAGEKKYNQNKETLGQKATRKIHEQKQKSIARGEKIKHETFKPKSVAIGKAMVKDQNRMMKGILLDELTKGRFHKQINAGLEIAGIINWATTMRDVADVHNYERSMR